MDTQYKNTPDGHCGNEDCGQMSSWYVFGAMGFYPVLPGSDYYVIGTPLFEELVINLENGNLIKSMKIKLNNIDAGCRSNLNNRIEALSDLAGSSPNPDWQKTFDNYQDMEYFEHLPPSF